MRVKDLIAGITVIALIYHDAESMEFDLLESLADRGILLPLLISSSQNRGPFPAMRRGFVSESPHSHSNPADISHMQGRCSMGHIVNVASIFQGLFVPTLEVDALVKEAKMNLVNSSNRISNSYSIIESNRLSKTIGRANSPGNSGGSGDCCDTEMRMTAPYTVLENGRRMQVVHMNTSYQFVHEGVCVHPKAKCREFGECVQVYKYSYMLLYDPNLFYMYPPVRFGRVQVKSHCECMNIGV